jgi:hypothetical protein
MNSLYQFNIQPLQGCDIQYIVDRGFTPMVIQIAPLRGTIYIEIKRISSNSLSLIALPGNLMKNKRSLTIVLLNLIFLI